MRSGPIRDIAFFAEALRHRGMTVTPDQMSDMARSLLLVDPASRSHVYAAFRSLAITDPSQRVPYDEEFRRFFESTQSGSGEDQSRSRLAAATAVAPIIETFPEHVVEESPPRSGTSAVENVAQRDFADLDDDQLAEARQMVMRMWWDPSDVLTRRWALDSRGRRPDMRRTLHGAIGLEGDLLRIEMQQRRTRQRPLIVIADISGSMEKYAELFLVFAHAALQRLRLVEVFTFSTTLTRITEDLARRDTKSALAKVSASVTDWSGGTKIGAAIAEWNQAWSRRLARGGPVVLVLSDGWDCGDPETLSREMGRLARSVHQVLWLNPLAARSGYEPATRGMKAILPHIDHLLPAASVNDLRGVVRLLEAIGTSR